MNKEIEKRYKHWLENIEDPKIHEQLEKMNEEEIVDAFYTNLAFGTGGLRGVMGLGTNKMNEYVVAKASKGLADYLNERYENPKVVIGYDTRNNSDVYSKVAANVFRNSGIKVFLYPKAYPVPMVSFGVRELGCQAGVMVTASHNPKIYNGYKVYGEDGCQITTTAAKEILDKISAVDELAVDKTVTNDLEYVSNEVYEKFIASVRKQTYLYDEKIDKSIAIIYTPLNGTGLTPVCDVLSRNGYTNIITVQEQTTPDGNFPTCPFPNPEVHQAMSLGMEYARNHQADILIATDPDCDRVGVAIKDEDDYRILTGNEVGILLFDYILNQRKKNDDLPKEGILVKTIVSTDLVDIIAKRNNIKPISVLTGFKYIGEKITLLEKEHKEDNFVFGFEESDGYLAGSHVRDKDGVVASTLIVEMFAYYHQKGIALLDRLKEIYKEYGYYVNSLSSFEFPGVSGMEKMKNIMSDLRAKKLAKIGDYDIERIEDYLEGIGDLPKENVLKYYPKKGGFVVIRPSGTEPKIKVYLSATGNDYLEAEKMNKELQQAISKLFE